jgi:uncharacterized membrane protein
VRRGRSAALLLTVLLIALGLAWELVLAPTGRGFWALKVLPLAWALPGLMRHRLYTYRWLSLALWLYVLEGLVRATSGEAAPASLLAALQTVLAVGLFAVVGLYVRQRLRGPRSASNDAPPAAA